MGSHYPDVKVIQTSQGYPSTEKRKIYPVKPVSPPSARVHYEDETTTLEPPRLVNFYLTGVGFKVKEPVQWKTLNPEHETLYELVQLFKDVPEFYKIRQLFNTEGGSYGIFRKNRAF